MHATQKSRISALLPASLTRELRRISNEKHITQSSIIEKALRLWLQHKLRSDTKQLAQIDFDDLPTEEEWAAIQSDIR